MYKYAVGDTVLIVGRIMPGLVGTVVHLDHKRSKYLVRIDATLQNYFEESDLEKWQR